MQDKTLGAVKRCPRFYRATTIAIKQTYIDFVATTTLSRPSLPPVKDRTNK